jgi:hypothetical protein
MLIPKGQANSYLDQRQSQVQGKEGVFQFRDVPPGVHVLQSQFAETEIRDPTGEFTKSTLLVARMEVTVGDQNIENLLVRSLQDRKLRVFSKQTGPIRQRKNQGPALLLAFHFAA